MLEHPSHRNPGLPRAGPASTATWANLGLLAALVVVMTALATLAFRADQRSA